MARFLLGLMLLAAGGLLLASIVPHVLVFDISHDRNLIEMRWLRVNPEPPAQVAFTFGPAPGLVLGAGRFVSIYAAALLTLLVLWPTTRRLLTRWLASPGGWLAGLLSLAALVLTLWPVQTINTPYTGPITVYQMLGLLAFLLLLAGIQTMFNTFMARAAESASSPSPALADSPPGTSASAARSPLVQELGRLWLLGVLALRNCPLWLFLSVLFAVQLAVCAWYSTLLFERLPHVVDGIAQLFHARIFSLGLLTAPAPPLPEFFQLQHIIITDRWYSQYPPGHTLLLLLGLLTGYPWLVNPLLGALTIVAAYFAGREMYDDRTGRLAALLALLSPFITFMSSEYMNHATALLCLVVFVWQFARLVRDPHVFSGLLAGFAGGYFLLTRPFTAAAMLLPFGVYCLWLLGRRFRTYVRTLAAMTVVGLVLAGGLLWFNWATNGSPFLFGYEVRHGAGHNPGFGHSGWGPAHTIGQGAAQTVSNLAALNKFLFEWPIPALTFAALFFAVGKKNRWDWLLLASFLCLLGAYWTYWYQDWAFGPRFLYEASVPLILLTVRGLQALYRVIVKFGSEPQPNDSLNAPNLGNLPIRYRRRLVGLALLGAVLTCVFCSYVGHIPFLRKNYQNYFRVNARLLKQVEDRRLSQALVFCMDGFTSTYALMPPLLDGPVIFARDQAGQNQNLARRFPDRACYREVDGELVPVDYKK